MFTMVSTRGIFVILTLACILQMRLVTAKSKKASSKGKKSISKSKLKDICIDKSENEICANGRGFCVTPEKCKKKSGKCKKNCIVGTVCESLPEIDNGWLSLANMTDNVQGAIAHIRCCDGYMGSGQITCGAAGVWDTPDSQSCTPKECTVDALPVDDHGTYVIQSSPAQFPGGVANLICNSASGMCDSSKASITCTSNGTWSSAQSECLQDDKCPSDDWKFYGTSCYLFGTEKLNVTEAQEYCRNQNSSANLVFIDNIAENAFLRKILIEKAERKSYWIGITDENSEGTFKSIPDEVKEADVTCWRSPMSNNTNKNCVVFYRKGYDWEDVRCRRTFRPVCEIDLCT